MNDLAGRGYPGGSALTAGETARRRDAQWSNTCAEEATTIIPIDELEAYSAAIDTRPVRSPNTREPHYRPTRSELTQDILIPAGEFDRYAADQHAADQHAIDEHAVNAPGARRHSSVGHAEVATAHSGELDLRFIRDDEARLRSVTDAQRTRTRGKHRLATPPPALRGGRAALIAMAAGAAVAAAHLSGNDVTTPTHAAEVGKAASTIDLGPGVTAASPKSPDLSTFTSQLAVGKHFADVQARREALASRPLFVSPLPLGTYEFTSGFAMRWGSFHGGIDFAAPLGTPIHAATDGVVIEAGPASGYGNWIQIRADDGTVTMYGHMASAGVLVHQGQHVTAGDVIALVGSEGFSTGPHCHFEVWKNGTMKIDPMPWLAAHGVRLSAYVG
ncbi:MAG: M23 family metallopeptidase [Gordonia sp. (in: high G+C Gram-positive bacteria)]